MKHYDYIGKVSEGLIRVKNGLFPYVSCGYINEIGQEIIPLVYTGVRDFHEGLAAVKIGNYSTGKWGFINIHGELIIPYLFDRPRPFSCGMAKVIYNNEWYFIDMKGNRIISLKNYDGGSNYHNDYAIVSKPNESNKQQIFGIINKIGTEVIPCNAKRSQSNSFFTCSTLAENVRMFNNGI